MRRNMHRWTIFFVAALAVGMLSCGALAADSVGYCTLDHDHSIHAECTLDHNHACDECPFYDGWCHGGSGHHGRGRRRGCGGYCW